jgi:two-component system, OmpR family, KDP operon response regulator KdpE
MQKPRILVVDDDPGIRKFVRANLDARDYEVLLAENGMEAITVFKKESVDLVILDIMMPFLDGYEVCRRIRETSKVPIIMLSAKDGENDKLRCLELGADDYLTKPFSLNELLCRIKVIFRRTAENNFSLPNSRFNCGELEIDYNRHMVFVKGEDANLTDTEYKILSFLSMNAGRIIAPEYILEKVWGGNHLEKHHLLWVNMCRLRNKLSRISAGSNYIQTRPGLGYLMTMNQN